jgi:hypothetical protein
MNPAPVIGSDSAGIKERSRGWLNSWPRTLTLSEGNLFLLLAIMIGLFSGLAVVCFRITIE